MSIASTAFSAAVAVLPSLVAAGQHEPEGEVEHFEVFHVEWPRVEVPYVVFVWILTTTFVKLGGCSSHLEDIFCFAGFQKAPGIKNYFPESSILIVVGLLIGIVLFLADYNQNVVTLTPDIFFLFLLPPIIGEAGYFMPNRLFFDQLGTILLMAVVGTIFNMFTIGELVWDCHRVAGLTTMIARTLSV